MTSCWGDVRAEYLHTHRALQENQEPKAGEVSAPEDEFIYQHGTSQKVISSVKCSNNTWNVENIPRFWRNGEKDREETDGMERNVVKKQ